LRELKKIPNGRDHGEERAHTHPAAADRRRRQVAAVGGRGQTDLSRCDSAAPLRDWCASA
jgi:hypothetical protein